MHISKIIRPVNSMIFIADSEGGVIPEWKRGPLILSTRTCISVRCYPEQDGPTQIVLGSAREVDPGKAPAFDGDLETPNYSIAVSTVEREVVLETTVQDTRTRVYIWLSHPQWPEKVTIGVG